MNGQSGHATFNELFPSTTSLLAWRAAYKARKKENQSLAEESPGSEEGKLKEVDDQKDAPAMDAMDHLAGAWEGC